MVRKADQLDGNTFCFVVNSAMWNVVQRVLGDYLGNRKTDQAYLWSKGGGGKYIKVGATFDAYEWGGNTIIFKPDMTLSREYKEPFAMCLDLTTGKTSAQPPIGMYSFKGQDFEMHEIYGPGLGQHTVSTPVAGGQMIAWGTHAIAVYNPYKSFILRGVE